ncbi:MAG: UDP-N-acetylmuramoyl-L-alanyl-D-glutamate--2,6-diaminopimelate ligase [Coriobacteriia bacterium]|nr:UDP-N-acetylmuramoyl-L-alanyl-D-glutamate--2,6-diaminopimelate ligase [Coriobacteriia bacterium]
MSGKLVTYKLAELLTKGEYPESLANLRVAGVAFRSDLVTEGDAFFCIRGFLRDGHDFAEDARARGASVLFVERPLSVGLPQVVVDDSRAALARFAAAFHGQPSKALDVIGITGTNGKTTSAYLVENIARTAGRVTGMVGTVETRIGNERVASVHTTPESAELQGLLARMRGAGVQVCAMEVSSHAIDLHRVDAVDFAVVALTNLTQDHLDYHHTIEEYASVKRRLFTEMAVGARVINIDDSFGRGLAERFTDAVTVGFAPDAHVQALDCVTDGTGAMFALKSPEGSMRMRLPLTGGFNVSNALVSAGCSLAVGIPFDAIVSGLESAPQVPGRLERIECGQPFNVVVDYAHTPDSLEKAILTLKQITCGDVIVVFGCGGDRDPAKRPMMGHVAARFADHTVITSDNPRSESPASIISQIEDGMHGGGASYELEPDRRLAVEKAVRRAKPGDAVLIAGKGHEDYQVFADQTVHFDDREVAREVLGAC